jgi:NIMA (never in mitosis gene a)-related kinase
MQEAELLKQLQHSNIVQYKESFIESGVLIIIMEYCMVGDLSFHIKNRKNKGEFLTETEIMNWFIQIC